MLHQIASEDPKSQKFSKGEGELPPPAPLPRPAIWNKVQPRSLEKLSTPMSRCVSKEVPGVQSLVEPALRFLRVLFKSFRPKIAPSVRSKGICPQARSHPAENPGHVPVQGRCKVSTFNVIDGLSNMKMRFVEVAWKNIFFLAYFSHSYPLILMQVRARFWEHLLSELNKLLQTLAVISILDVDSAKVFI